MNILRTAFAGALFLASTTSAFVAQAADFITIQLKDGPVVIELLPDVAPKHAERMKQLARALAGMLQMPGKRQLKRSKR